MTRTRRGVRRSPAIASMMTLQWGDKVTFTDGKGRMMPVRQEQRIFVVVGESGEYSGRVEMLLNAFPVEWAAHDFISALQRKNSKGWERYRIEDIALVAESDHRVQDRSW